MQPGETITPGAAPTPAPGPEKQDQPATNWQFNEDRTEPQGDASAQPASPLVASWSASEYIAHNKGAAWFVLLGIVLLAFIGAFYVATKDIVVPVVVAVAGITFGVFAARSPRVLEYTVNAKGIQIGPKFYTYADFKSFSVAEDGPLPAIVLLPLKRFLPPITVFYEPKEEDTILNVLANYLPHEEKQPDLVDKLMRRIRF